VLQVLLARSAGAEDVCVGVVDANRGDGDQITRMVGCFVNMLPVRGHVSRTASFADVVREASRKALAAFAHAGVPFDVLLDAVQAPRWSDGATAPLIQAAANYRAAGWGQLPLGADCRMALRLDDGKDAETPYDVSLGLMDLAEGCTIDLHTRAALYGANATRGSTYYHFTSQVSFTYKNLPLCFYLPPYFNVLHFLIPCSFLLCLLFLSCLLPFYKPHLSFGFISPLSRLLLLPLQHCDPANCVAVLQVYVRLVTAFAADPDMRINKCPLHDEAQVKEARVLGTGPETNFGWPATLSQRVQDMCRLHAAELAIIDGSGTITYSQLAARVNAVAKALRSAGGTTTGDRVAVLCEPSVDAAVAMLAVLQTGCVYVPLDTSLPAARHAAIIESCKPLLLLYHTATEESVLELGKETSTPFPQMLVGDIPEVKPDMQVPYASDPTAPAILLFTSGSTGTPKGILLTQGNFANHIALKTQVLDLGPKDRVLQQSSLGFDMSLVQTFCALANGGCLVVVPRDARRDPVALTALLREHAVSLTIATPSEYLAWLHYGDGSLRDHAAWRHACMGGELVSTELKRELSRLELKGLRLTNCYGPTEITAAATFQTIDPNDYADGGDEDADDSDEQHQRAKYAIGNELLGVHPRLRRQAAARAAHGRDLHRRRRRGPGLPRPG
jgi:non-ribosomal peptide synthetase component F